MQKKAFFTMHPGMFFIVGLIIGAVVVYYLIKAGTIPIALPK